MFNQSLNPRSVTFNIILINILFYLVYNVYANQYTNPELHGQITAACALFYPASHWFKPLQIVTHMFMHANFWHIFGNMFGLFMFGAVLEKVWGPQRFMIFYFVTGLGAALLYMAV